MADKLDGKMVIGISSRALFDLTEENEIYETQGLEAYVKYQVAHENEILKPGPGFGLVKSLLQLNQYAQDEDLVEVVIMSRNSPDTSLRMFNSIAHYNLNITRSVLANGASVGPYLSAFNTDLFLSAYEDDVQRAIDSGIAAGIICTDNASQIVPIPDDTDKNGGKLMPGDIRIAFDGDAVLFADDSELIYKEKGLLEFERNEREKANEPMAKGPFADFLRKLSELQDFIGREDSPIRTALVTSRSVHVQERVIRTMRSWNVRVDEAFFLGGLEKRDCLKAFGAQIFFDDQTSHTQKASEVVPSARVPYGSETGMHRYTKMQQEKKDAGEN